MLMACIGVVMQLARYQIISRLLALPYKVVLKHVLTPSAACILAVTVTTSMRGLMPIDSPAAGLVFSALFVLGSYVLLLVLGCRWLEPPPGELLVRIQSLFRPSHDGICNRKRDGK